MMRTRLVGAALILASAIGPAPTADVQTATSAPSRAIPTEIRLANGLLVLAVPSSSSRLNVATTYFVGNRDEPDGQRGAAHLLEHLAMRETRSGARLAADFAAKNISGGAVTGGDLTIFSASGPATQATLDEILRLERLRMTELSLDDAAIQVERERVRTETGGRSRDIPVAKVVFGAHRLGRSASHADLSTITGAALRRMYATYYTPSNCLMVIESSLPPADVRRSVERALDTVPKQTVLARPVNRDRTPLFPVLSIAPPSPPAEGGLVATLAVPGLQHADRIALEREVSALPITLTDEAPASLLRIRLSARDVAAAHAEIDRLIATPARAGAGRSASAGGARRGPDWWDCEAAGDWRYCVDIAAARNNPVPAAAPLVTLDRYMKAARANAARDSASRASALWPSTPRPAPSVTASLSVGPPEAKKWIAPALGDIRWAETAAGVQWAAARGGADDSVFMTTLLVLPVQSDARDVALIEMWARVWASLRLPSGAPARPAFEARGATVTVRSLPYPPMATADSFRMLNVQPTPLGLAGVEISAVSPAASAPEVARLVAEMVTSGVPDPAAVSSERDRQAKLLAAAAGAPGPTAELAFRQATAGLASQTAAAWRPEPFAAQLRIMQAVTADHIQDAVRRLAGNGLVRVAVLGAAPHDVETWIAKSAWPPVKGSRPVPAPPSCPTTPAADVRLPGAPVTANVYLAICIPIGAPMRVPAEFLVANALLGGREDALLASRLRTDTGLADFFESRVLPMINGQATIWYLHYTTQSDTVDQSIAEVRAVLDKIRAGAVPAERIVAFRDWLADRRAERAREGLVWVTSLVSAGVPPEDEIAAIRATTPAQVNAALRDRWNAASLAITASSK
jgi:predicted Zn-dependent peptidase